MQIRAAQIGNCQSSGWLKDKACLIIITDGRDEQKKMVFSNNRNTHAEAARIACEKCSL
jgi:hypothetical protein